MTGAKWTRLFSGFLVGLLPIAAALADAESARSWLEDSHRAAGGSAWDEVHSMRTELEVKLPGLEGTATSLTDLETGRYNDRVILGSFRFASGYDGQTAWEQDTSGQVQRQDSAGDREGDASERYRRMLAHWYPERWPATLEDLGSREEGDRSFQRIRITPDGGRPFVFWIDHRTKLVDRIVENDGTRYTTSFLFDYGELDGRMVPRSTRHTSGEEKYDQYTSLTSFEVNVDVDESAFAMPAPPPPDYRFADGKVETTVPFRLLNNHTYLDVRLNGEGPFTMILDTGGANVITPNVAERLGIQTEGQLEARGVGERSQNLSLAQLDSVTIGAVTVENQTFYVIDFEELSRAEGVTLDGLVGYEVFKRFVTRLDYGESRLTLSDPEHFRYQGGGIPVRFEFDGRTPVVAGAIDGIEGKLTFDTGSRGYVSLHAPFVSEHGLLERYPEAVDGINGWGVGGPTRSRVLRGRSLRIGDEIIVAEPIMSLSLQDRGAMTDRYQIANLGAGILSRFNLVFDYASQVVYFERHPGSDRADQYDRAGIWLNDVGASLEVMGVVADGPASEAGLAEGDRITAVDGIAARELFLPELRERWRRSPPGTRVTLDFLRDGNPVQTTMVLRDLIAPPEQIAGGGS